MRKISAFVVISAISAAIASAASDDFTGTWKLDPARSEIRSMPTPPDPFLRVEQSAASLTIYASVQENGPSTPVVYPLDHRSEKRQAGNASMNTVTKWEGDALLVNTLVSGPANYTVMERWERSRDGSTLKIHRTIVRMSGETESLLVYERPGAPVITKAPDAPANAEGMPRRTWARAEPAAASDPQAPAQASDYVVQAGTRVLLRLTNAVNTKTAAVGDRVYLQTAVPVFVNGRLVIPRGSYVTGTITETHRAGRVKGRSELSVRFDSITLPNGVNRDLAARPSAADAQGNLERKEGRIEGEGNKGGDARTVGQTTAAGAGIGTLAGAASGHLGMGAGIGAAAGAAAGLGRVFGSRGPDVMLRAGTTMEMTFDRDVTYAAHELMR